MPDPDYGGGNYNSGYGTGATSGNVGGSVNGSAGSGASTSGNVGGSDSASNGGRTGSTASSNSDRDDRGGAYNSGYGSAAPRSSNSDRDDRGGAYNSGYGSAAPRSSNPPAGTRGGTSLGSLGGSASASGGVPRPSGVLGGGGVTAVGGGIPAPPGASRPSAATLAQNLPSLTQSPYSGAGPVSPLSSIGNIVSGLDVPPAYTASERERMLSDPTVIPGNPTYPSLQSGLPQRVAGGKVDRLDSDNRQDRVVTDAVGVSHIINMAAPMSQPVAAALSNYTNPPVYSSTNPVGYTPPGTSSSNQTPPANPADGGAVRDYVTGGVRAPTGTGTQPSGVLGGGGVVAYGGGVPATGSTAAPPSQNVASNGVTGQQQASVSPSQQSGNGGFSFGLGGTPSFGQGGEGAIGPPVLPPASSEPPPATPDPSANPIADAAIQAGVMPWDVSTYLQILAIYKKAGQAFTPKDFIRAYYKPRVFADPSFELPRANAA